MAMPQMFNLCEELLRPRAKKLDYLVALGTHPPMTDAQLSQLIGHPVVDGKSGQAHIFNHHWENPDIFLTLGTIPASEIEQITNGRLSRNVPVRLNKLILQYD